jgi:ribosome-associated toxin RatA of RatAB toxin-antitoxin module
MRRVEIQALIPNAVAGQVFDTLADFERYPALVEVVRSVSVGRRESDGQLLSTWEVYFRNGVLTWTEADWLRRDELRMDFEQTQGDFDEMSGSWVIEQRGDAVGVAFVSDFDFGIPSLASIIDPVAVRVLTETIQLILVRLFETVQFPSGDVVIQAPAREGTLT